MFLGKDAYLNIHTEERINLILTLLIYFFNMFIYFNWRLIIL